MASKVDIANRALQMLGAKRIIALTDDSKNARAANFCFDILREAELRKHPWMFAIRLVSLAEDTTAPIFGKAHIFTLPADFLALRSQYPEDNNNKLDWVLEGRKIATNDTAPLEVRYTASIEDPNIMDALFRETLSARMAKEMVEEITQSNTKKKDAVGFYDEAINDAKKANAFDRVASEQPVDEWITVRGTSAISFTNTN